MLYQLPEREIRKKIRAKDAKISVIGLGRVGLPLATTLAEQGFQVSGIDVNEEIVSKVKKGMAPFREESGLQELVEKNVEKKRLKASSNMNTIKNSALVSVSAPTLLTRNKKPDITAIENVARDVAELSEGKVISLESTVPPSTTQSFGKIIEEKTGLKTGRDFGLAYSPERVQAPQILKDLKTYPKIVGGVDNKSTLIVSEIYRTFAPKIIKMSSPISAEIVKLLENAQRDVNIALVNEISKTVEEYGVDIFEVINAANSQPFCDLPEPGCGVGGHCIPVDPYYLIKSAEQRGHELSLLRAARKINEMMPEHIVNMMKDNIEGGKVAVLGLSFKPDVKAFKYSHTLKIIDLLEDYKVVVHDPFLEEEKFDFETEKDVYVAVKEAECVFLATAHSAYKELDLKKIKKLMSGNLIVDGRGFFIPVEVKKAGLDYVGVGRFHDD